MVSNAKRFRYDSENYFHSSDESDDLTSNGENQNDENDDVDVKIRRYQSQRKPKCFSKNAQMARENRLRKKIYVAKLEKQVETLKKDNVNLSSIIDGQSSLLNELKNEVKYLKAVIGNSSDISKLLKNINRSTGMSVSTSINKSLRIPKKNSNSNQNVPIARKTMHPWEENDNSCSSILTEKFTDRLFEDLDFNIPLNNDSDLFPYNMNETGTLKEFEDNTDCMSLEEHNYTRGLASERNLEGLQIYLLKLCHQFKSLRHLNDEIASYITRMSIVKKCIVPFFQYTYDASGIT